MEDRTSMKEAYMLVIVYIRGVLMCYTIICREISMYTSTR